MKKTTNVLSWPATALAILLVPGAYIHAQVATDSKASEANASDHEVVVLSPFEVTTSATSDGYVAADTLAGNRLNTNLRDIGSSVTVVTSQLLRDTAATDNTTLLQRIGGAEVGGVNGNYAAPGPNSSSTLLTEDTIRPTEATRIRGLAAADNTRDFFLTDIPWDSYNTDRIDIQRGPNAILFGEGSPAGIINSTSYGAIFKNTGNVEFRFGSWGSARGSMDINQQIVPGQVAVRVDLLADDKRFEQDPAYSNERRVSGAIRIEPSFLNKNGNRTIIKGNFESGRIDSDNPRALLPTDHITPWFDPTALVYKDANGNIVPKGTAGATGVPNSGAYQAGLNGLNSWVSGEPGNFVSTLANGYAEAGRATGPNADPYFTNGQLGNAGFPLAAFQNGSTVGAAGTYAFTSLPQPGTASTVGLVWPYGAFPGAWLTLNGAAKTALFGPNIPYANGGLFTDTSMTDPSAFNFYKNLIDGRLKKEWQDFHTWTANLTQTFLHDQVGFSLDYNKQHDEFGQVNPLGGAVPLYVDVMSTLNQAPGGGTVTGPFNGPPTNAAPNPNYGRPFVLNNNFPTNFEQSNDREDSRATAFVTHDFSKDGSDWWRKVLGVQTLSGLADRTELTTDNMNWQQYGYLGANTLLAAKMDGLSSANFQNVAPQEVIYLGDSLVGKSLAGANISRITGSPTIGSQSINYFDFTPNPANAALGSTNPGYYVGWAGQQTLTVTNSEDDPSVNRRLLATADAITRSVTTSQALVYEGKWLDGALVGIYGWRKDINKSWADSANLGDANNPQSIDFNNIGFSADPQGRVEVQSRSYSIVAHLSEFPGLKDFANKLPFELSLAYNESSNFQPNSARVDINGSPVAPPKGKTIDRGIRIATRDGKYALKVNRFETNISNGVNPNGQAFAQSLANFVGFSAYYGNVFYYGTDQSTPLQGGPTSVPDGHPVIGQPANTGGVTGSGYYFENVNGVDTYTQRMADLQAASTAATRAWETQINTDFPNFFKNWGLGSLDQVQAGLVPRNQLQGITGETNFAITEDSQSKGWEIELDANPVKGLRLTFNATETEATITQVGDPALVKFMADTAAYVAGPGGSQQWFWGENIAPSVPNVALAYYNNYNGVAPLGTFYAELLQQQGVAASQLAKWRYNLTANYDFDHAFLKGVNIGGGVRYTDREIIGYPPSGNPANPPPYLSDTTKPYYSPSETYFDLWVGYHRKLTKKIAWNIQLNVANVGKRDSLIPISYQAPVNGVAQPAFYRIAPTQQFTLTNRFEF
jgi:outer membrane receptor protein involved in Fe transport